MNTLLRTVTDRSPFLLAEGYAWLPNRMRASAGPALRTRVLGRPALAVRGPEAVRFFYDERNVLRHGALPGPVLDTLFGRGAVHTLDGETHRARKELFLPLLDAGRVADLTQEVLAAWDEAVASWAARPEVVLLDEAGEVLTRAVHRWTGVPLAEEDAGAVAGDLVAMVDGFASPGPRHWRARRARRRQESRLARLVEDVRAGTAFAPDGSFLDRAVRHREADGRPLDARTAAVELLNVLRPTVAVRWLVAFAAHALHRRPEHRERLEAEDPAFATAYAHEVRRFYPFVPFLGGVAATDLTWHGERVPAGGLVLLDVYGQNHDEELWGDPYTFRPARFLERPPARDELIPQGGGDPRTGHRCPGEDLATALVSALATRFARLECTVPPQDLTISLRRVPARPASGFRVTDVRTPVAV
ncbi:fatty-acid peroxygenase [Streptomyces albiaxialis]|uniref:Fatty-acid peroxygenase n=1 Tax=Streptomyces albiaxialis TaxID=329523 RepID=A0ABN2W0S1_9ACTN